MVETFTTDVDDLIKRHVGEEGRDIQASHVLVLDVQRLGQFCKLEGVLDAVPLNSTRSLSPRSNSIY